MNLIVTIRRPIWKLKHLVNAPRLVILMITVCWCNWNVSPHARMCLEQSSEVMAGLNYSFTGNIQSFNIKTGIMTTSNDFTTCLTVQAGVAIINRLNASKQENTKSIDTITTFEGDYPWHPSYHNILNRWLLSCYFSNFTRDKHFSI